MLASNRVTGPLWGISPARPNVRIWRRVAVPPRRHIPFDFPRPRSIGVITESQPVRPAAAPPTRSAGALGGGSGAVPLRLKETTHDQASTG